MNVLRRPVMISTVAFLVVTALLVSRDSHSQDMPLGISVARADEDSCSVATLHGTYATHAQGTFVGQLPPTFPAPPLPFGEAGIVTFDGKGQITSGKLTVNLGGVVSPGVQVIASGSSYTVNSDCTGTVTVQSNVGFAVHDAIVVTRGGRATVDVETDPFAVITRTLEKIGD